jgi:hypothetical protein
MALVKGNHRGDENGVESVFTYQSRISSYGWKVKISGRKRALRTADSNLSYEYLRYLSLEGLPLFESTL